MSSSRPSEQAQLQDLKQAISANHLDVAAMLAFTLAERGALPIVELFGLAGLLSQAGDTKRTIATWRRVCGQGIKTVLVAAMVVASAALPARAAETYDIPVVLALTGYGAFLGKEESAALLIAQP